MMRLGIFGSRTLDGEKVKNILINIFEKMKPEMIVTAGEIEGVSKVARYTARQMSIPLLCHFPNKKYAQGCYQRRSEAILKSSDKIIIIHDGESNGTRNELKMVKKMGVPHEYIKIKKQEFKFENIFDTTSAEDFE